MTAARRIRGLLVTCSTALLLVGCNSLSDLREKAGVEVRYEGNEELDVGDLDRALKRFFQDIDKSRFKKSAVDDGAFDLERAYLEAGFPDAKVRYRYEERPGQEPLAVFLIEEGPRASLEEVKITGNQAVSKKDIEAFFAPRATGLFEASERWFVESRVRVAGETVQAMYQARGYLDAQVAIERIEFDATRTNVTVHVDVHEGTLYRVIDIAVTGGDPRVDPKLVEGAVAPFRGRPYYERLSVEILGQIEELFADHGFADVKVVRTKRVSSSDGIVELAYSVDAGPQMIVGPIQVSGNEMTRSKFVRSRLEFEPGDIYSREDERKSFGHLFRSGVFDRVTIQPVRQEGETGDTVTRPVRVDLVEGPAIETFIEPGWGSYERLRVALGARHRNLFGTGRILDFHGVVGGIAQNGTLSLIDPWLFESDVVANLSIFGNRREEPSFLRLETGVGAALTRRFSSRFEGSVGYQFKASDAQDVTVFDADAQEAAEKVNISEVIGTASYDTRDNVFVPTEGYVTKGSLEWAGKGLGSEVDFVRVKWQHAGFVPLSAASVIGWSIKGGVIAPVSATTTIPLQERFYNGGENTVRSFEEQELGPKDIDGTPLGGEAYSVFSLELRQRLRGRLEGALFWDVGNVTPDYKDFWKLEGYEQGIGAGIRYTFPVGPIRIDAAWNPNPGVDDPDYVVHLSFGMAF
jgi:outer membrane protein insertion porin family